MGQSKSGSYTILVTAKDIEKIEDEVFIKELLDMCKEVFNWAIGLK